MPADLDQASARARPRAGSAWGLGLVALFSAAAAGLSTRGFVWVPPHAELLVAGTLVALAGFVAARKGRAYAAVLGALAMGAAAGHLLLFPGVPRAHDLPLHAWSIWAYGRCVREGRIRSRDLLPLHGGGALGRPGRGRCLLRHRSACSHAGRLARSRRAVGTAGSEPDVDLVRGRGQGRRRGPAIARRPRPLRTSRAGRLPVGNGRAGPGELVEAEAGPARPLSRRHSEPAALAALPFRRRPRRTRPRGRAQPARARRRQRAVCPLTQRRKGQHGLRPIFPAGPQDRGRERAVVARVGVVLRLQ